MTGKFHPTVLHGDGWTYVRLEGVIDEDNRLRELSRDIRGDLLLVDLRGVERINSCGVRDWVSWLEVVAGSRAETALLDVSPAMVAQLNLVGNFATHSSVMSVRAPYYCEGCDLERSLILEVSDLTRMGKAKAPQLPCEACGLPMAFDDIEESYFAFVGEVRPTHVHPRLTAALADARGMLGDSTGPISKELVAMADAAPAPPAPEPEAKQADVIFYIACGVLSAVLAVVIYNLATG